MKNCFVIMLFSQTTDKHDERYWTEFSRIIQNIMQENNYECIRSEIGAYKVFTKDRKGKVYA